MRKIILGRNILTFALATAACALGQTVDGGSVVTVPAGGNNALTQAERDAGYKLLWNGVDFTGTGTDMDGSGWKANSSTTNPSNPSSNWAIVTTKGLESNDTHKSTNPDSNMLEVAAAGNSIFTNDSTYLNFDWKMEWQAVVGLSGNSGMLPHYKISVNTNNNYSAPEYQLCNQEWSSEWKTALGISGTNKYTTAGNNYLMTPLLRSRANSDDSPSWVRAEGHWNQSRIISYGARTAHYGNGLRLLEYRMLSPEWNTAYNASKYKGLGVYNTIHSGSFYIQDHGEKWMKFRNIRVKRLTQNPWAAGSPYLNPDSVAIGDSALVDNLTFNDNLFATTTAVSPNTIVPKYATKVVANRDGLSIQFSQPGDYTLTVEDVRGFRFSKHSVHHADRIFLPGQFSNSPRILTIWNGDKKIRESIVTGK